MEKRIVYSTYESLHQAFKQTTAISDTNMRKAMEKLIHMFLKDELSIDSLQNSLVKVKEDLLLFKEKRVFCSTFVFEPALPIYCAKALPPV